jgi:hypothetical protein
METDPGGYTPSDTNQELAASHSLDVGGHQEVRGDTRGPSVYSEVSSGVPSMHSVHPDQPVLGQPVTGNGFLGRPVDSVQTPLNSPGHPRDRVSGEEPSQAHFPQTQNQQQQFQTQQQQFQTQQPQVQQAQFPQPQVQQAQFPQPPQVQQLHAQYPPQFPQLHGGQQMRVESYMSHDRPASALNESGQYNSQYYPPPNEPPPEVRQPYAAPPFSPSPQLSTASNSPHLSSKPIVPVGLESHPNNGNAPLPSSMQPMSEDVVNANNISDVKSETSNNQYKRKVPVFKKRCFWVGITIAVVLVIAAAIGELSRFNAIQFTQLAKD